MACSGNSKGVWKFRYCGIAHGRKIPVSDTMQKIYTGFHAVEERIRRHFSEKELGISLKVLYSKPGPRIKKIISQAVVAGVDCYAVDLRCINSLVAGLSLSARDHRGIVLIVDGESEESSRVFSIETWLSDCPDEATIVMLNGVTDPHNVGAVIRSCDQFGVNLLILPEHHSANADGGEIVARASAGASAWLPTARVTNLTRTARLLRDSGFWIYGADAKGEPLPQVEFSSRNCIIMGSEGTGISRLLAEQCDKIISIPTCGKIDSLNVSVATGIFLYELLRQHSLPKILTKPCA